jgi:hypothetical protein
MAKRVSREVVEKLVGNGGPFARPEAGFIARGICSNNRAQLSVLLAAPFAQAFGFRRVLSCACVGTWMFALVGVRPTETLPLMIAARALVTPPAAPPNVKSLARLDRLGFALLAGGVVLLLIALNQGERRFWLETPWMRPLMGAAFALLVLALAWLLSTRAPPFDLGLLLRPTFAIGMADALSLRFGLLMASFAVPQALARLQGFRPGVRVRAGSPRQRHRQLHQIVWRFPVRIRASKSHVDQGLLKPGMPVKLESRRRPGRHRRLPLRSGPRPAGAPASQAAHESRTRVDVRSLGYFRGA